MRVGFDGMGGMKRILMIVAVAGALGSGWGFGETVRVYLGTRGRGESKGIYLSELDTESGALSAPKLAATSLVLSLDPESIMANSSSSG